MSSFTPRTHLFSSVFLTTDGQQPDAVDTTGLMCLPSQSAEESPDVAGRADQVVLKAHLGLTGGKVAQIGLTAPLTRNNVIRNV